MRITKLEIYINNSLDKKTKEIGIRKVTRLANISPAYICDLLKGYRNISEKLFKRLKIVIDLINDQTYDNFLEIGFGSGILTT